MKIGILGTGGVGRTLGAHLSAAGHDVMLAGRATPHEVGEGWAAEAPNRRYGTFADAAAHGEVVLNCTSGLHSVAAVRAAGVERLAGKVLVDVANPLDFSQGFPPSLAVGNTDSLGEQLQALAPEARVVKALNTVAASVMVAPAKLPGEHVLPLCGDDAEAKALVRGWLQAWFGWQHFVDLGPIHAARGQEAWLLLWTRLYGALGTGDFNIVLSRAPQG